MNSTTETPRARASRIDGVWPDWASVAAALAAWFSLNAASPAFLQFLTTDVGGLFGALVGLHGALLGFVLAALTIIMGYANSPQLRLLREAGQLPNLFRVYLAGIRSSALAMIVALGALIVRGGTPVADVLAWIVFFTTAVSLARLMRTLWVTRNVVARVGDSLARAAPKPP
ncbi:MAG: hypothetical protein K0Q52_92 [Microbacterium sp.]|nr:hypothetical protein [Microbacterium sp.]